jgi:invasion protein IalB
MTSNRTTLALGVGMLALACAQALAQAQPAPAASTIEGDSSGWIVRCTGAPPTCRAEQEIRLKNTHQLVVSAVVNMARDSKQPTMLIHLAHGVFLPAGATLQVGKRSPQRLEIQTCDAAGCYAGMPISKDALAALQSEQEMTVSFDDLRKRRITVRMSLAGFAVAYQKIQ